MQTVLGIAPCFIGFTGILPAGQAKPGLASAFEQAWQRLRRRRPGLSGNVPSPPS